MHLDIPAIGVSVTRIVKVKTNNRFEEIGCYSRAVAVGDWIFLSNTAGRNASTGVMPESCAEQTRQIFTNVAAALKAVDASLADIVAARVFVPNPSDMAEVMEIFAEHFRGIDPVLTATSPALGSPIYKVEIEFTAFRGVAAAKVETLNIAI
jgi:enamine deaminase RidA (YjgF/YER057c/UK114 family)